MGIGSWNIVAHKSFYALQATSETVQTRAHFFIALQGKFKDDLKREENIIY